MGIGTVSDKHLDEHGLTMIPYDSHQGPKEENWQLTMTLRYGYGSSLAPDIGFLISYNLGVMT